MLGRAAVFTGTALRLARPWWRALPSLAGAVLASLGAAMVYQPAGLIAGGMFLLWIGTELHGRR